MSRIHVYSPPLTTSDDPRLVQVFNELRQEERIDWKFVRGFAMSVGISAVMWYALVELIIWLWREL